MNSRRDGSAGCMCTRCVAGRNAIARNLAPLPPADFRPLPPVVPPPRLRLPPTTPECSPIEPESIDVFGTNDARNIPRIAPRTHSLPLLTPPTRESLRKAPPPTLPGRTAPLALGGHAFSPRAISQPVEGLDVVDDAISGTTSVGSGCVTHLSLDSSDTAPPAQLTDWYIANVTLPPATPVDLHRSTKLFEMQSVIPDGDSMDSLYRGLF